MENDFKENVIEWVNDETVITCTLNQKRYISKVRKLATKWPSLVSILAENPDGSIVCHLPIKSLKLGLQKPPKTAFKKKVTENGE